MSFLSNNKTEDILKWREEFKRQRQANNDGDILNSDVLSQITAASTSKNNNQMNNNNENNCKTNRNKNVTNFYITLAKESPKRKDEDSDTSATYDSFNAKETELCTDSSDIESIISIHAATVEVVEYEVASVSASEHLYTNDSSSGTDEEILVMATALFQSEYDKRSGFWSGDFADTEESDNSENAIDSELSVADYWVCVKCKNRQNNPMFRYCEKCYQIRKTHFPPRPRLCKNRRNRKRKATSLIYENKRRNSLSPVSDCRSDLSLSTARMTKSSNINQHYINQDSNNMLPSTSAIQKSSTEDCLVGNNMNLFHSNLHHNNISDYNDRHRKTHKKRRLNYTNNNINNKNNNSQFNSVTGTGTSASSSNSDDDDDNISEEYDHMLSTNSSSNQLLTLKLLNERKNSKKLNYHRKSPIFDKNKPTTIIPNLKNRKRSAAIFIDSDSDETDIEKNSTKSSSKRHRLENTYCIIRRSSGSSCTGTKSNSSSNSSSSSSDEEEEGIGGIKEKNCDNDSGTDLIINISNSENLFDKDSGISSAPQSSQEISTPPQASCSTSADEKLNSIPINRNTQKIICNKNVLLNNIHNNPIKYQITNDGDNSTENIIYKNLVENKKKYDQLLDKSNSLVVNKSNQMKNNDAIVQTNLTNDEKSLTALTTASTESMNSRVLGNLDRHLSDCLPIVNINSIINNQTSVKTDNDDEDDDDGDNTSILERSVSESGYEICQKKINLPNTNTNHTDNQLLSVNLKEPFDATNGTCIVCVTGPKNGVFVHSKFLHLCCCYKCAVKIWNKNKKCPICNCAVKNVMKLFVH